jgi:hypothetical protein
MFEFFKRNTEYDLPLQTRIWMALGFCRKDFGTIGLVKAKGNAANVEKFKFTKNLIHLIFSEDGKIYDEFWPRGEMANATDFRVRQPTKKSVGGNLLTGSSPVEAIRRVDDESLSAV